MSSRTIPPSAPASGELEQSFYKRVDNALYTSKENGKNRITIFDANGTTKALTMQESGDW